jgi:hypothetical protein
MSGASLAQFNPAPPTLPSYPDVPWWSVLVAALVFSIAGVVVGAYVGVGSLSSAAGTVSIGSFALDTVSYVPHILLLFGVLADMFTLQGVWSIPSLVGVLSIFANYLFEYFWKGLDSLVESAKTAVRKPVDQSPPPPSGGKRMKGGKLFESYTGCSVQGLEGWNSAYAPQTLVITATIFSYYCLDLVRNRGWVNSIGVLLSFVLAYLAQVGVISYNTSSVGCTVEGQETQYSPIMQGVRALFEGVFFGGISYAVVETYAKARLPSSAILPYSPVAAKDLTLGPDGKMVDANGNPYIILDNGLAIPDLSAPGTTLASGASSMASKVPGMAASCPSR